LGSFFADSSAIVKLYLPEPGSAWLLSLDLSPLAISALAAPELRSAFARRRREGALTAGQAARAWRTFREDFRTWQVIRLANPVLATACRLLGHQNSAAAVLRTLDALQLASAIEADRRLRRADGPALTVLTADLRLETAAASYGLAVENPARHL
jgi:predicted nucleic acid-binding protein